MILRYEVETKNAVVFTASRHVKDAVQAERIVQGLLKENARVGYCKYYKPILYTDINIEVRRWKF